MIVVCSGNICRSPIGEQLLQDALADAGLADRVTVSSACTGAWHEGEDMNPEAAAALTRAGRPARPHTAQLLDPAQAEQADLILVADRGHLRQVRAMVPDPSRVRLLRSFDPASGDRDVPDPYGGPAAGFDDVIDMTEAALPGIVAELQERLG